MQAGDEILQRTLVFSRFVILYGKGMGHPHTDISVGQIRGNSTACPSTCLRFADGKTVICMPRFDETFQVFPAPVFSPFLEDRIPRFKRDR